MGFRTYGRPSVLVWVQRLCQYVLLGHKDVSQGFIEDCGTDQEGNDVAIVNVCN